MNKSDNKNLFQNIAIALVIAIFFIIDRFLKMVALNSNPAQPLKLIDNILTFSFIPNYYMAFSLPFGGQILNSAIIFVVAALLIYILYLIKKRASQKIEITLLIVIFSGAISNIFDRLTYGYVIDYLELKYFTVFNLADAMISVGAFILIFLSLKNK